MPAVLNVASLVAAPWGMPENAAAHGVAFDGAMRLNLWIFASLFVLAHAVLLAGLLFRAKPEPFAHRGWRMELLPLAALAVLFFGLALHSERLWAAQRYSGADPAALQVEATGMQFAWSFRYPGVDGAFGATRPDLIDAGAGNALGLDPADERGRDDFVRSQLVLPVGREVDVRLRALDVMHGFAIPALRVKQNAIPGQTFHLHFTPVIAGDYSLLCTQVCGLGHGRMQAVVRVLPPPQFDAWMQLQERRRAAQAQP